jgi:cytochrome c-type biogenesis protein CcmH
MIVFIICAAGLVVLALLLILPPLLRPPADVVTVDENQANLALFRQQLAELDADLAGGSLDQGQYDAARRDLERDLLLDMADVPLIRGAVNPRRWAAPLLAVAVPALTVGLYGWVGDYAAITSAATPPVAETVDQASMEALVERLAERMRTHPDELRGWMLLGRSALVLGQEARAATAYEQAARLAPKDPDVLLAYAEVLARVGKGFEGKPADLIANALAIAPSNANALWMMGMVEFQRAAPAKALLHWTKLQAQLPADSENTHALSELVAEARRQLAASVSVDKATYQEGGRP